MRRLYLHVLWTQYTLVQYTLEQCADTFVTTEAKCTYVHAFVVQAVYTCISREVKIVCLNCHIF